MAHFITIEWIRCGIIGSPMRHLKTGYSPVRHHCRVLPNWLLTGTQSGVSGTQPRASAVAFTSASELAAASCGGLMCIHQITLTPSYRLKFSSEVTTGICSATACARIWRSKGSVWCQGRPNSAKACSRV